MPPKKRMEHWSWKDMDLKIKDRQLKKKLERLLLKHGGKSFEHRYVEPTVTRHILKKMGFNNATIKEASPISARLQLMFDISKLSKDGIPIPILTLRRTVKDVIVELKKIKPTQNKIQINRTLQMLGGFRTALNTMPGDRSATLTRETKTIFTRVAKHYYTQLNIVLEGRRDKFLKQSKEVLAELSKGVDERETLRTMLDLARSQEGRNN